MSHSYYKRVERKRLLCLRVDGDGSADNGTTAVVGQRMINNTGTASARASPLRSRTALRRRKTTLCRGTGCQLEAAAASLQCEWWQRPLDEERTSSWRKKSGSGKQTERAGDKRIEVEVKKETQEQALRVMR